MRAQFIVEDTEEGLSVAQVLRRHMSELAWTRVRRLIARGKVTLAGATITNPGARVRRGQEIAVDEAAPTPSGPRARIVFEDAHVIVIDKPAGVSSVPYERRELGTAMDLVREAWRKLGRPAAARPLLVVHRIDKDTSGLLAFATSKLAERGLAAQFRTHTIARTYLCVAHGDVKDVRIESRLVTDRGDGLRGSSRHPQQGKRAVTHVRAVEKLEGATLCEVRLETGKTHQIRIHLAEASHPLVGETVYIRDFLRAGRQPIASARLLLHAATLEFEHPVTHKRVALESPLPDDFLVELNRLRKTTR